MRSTLPTDCVRIEKKTNVFLLVIVLFSFLFSAGAQQAMFKEKIGISYTLQNRDQVSNAEAYIAAMNAADFSNYRLKSERNFIEFEGNVTVVLFSAEEVKNNGISTIHPDDYPLQIVNDSPSIFRLADNNYIVELKTMTVNKGKF
jgi:hypothetical protein